MTRNKNIEMLRAVAIMYMLLYHYSGGLSKSYKGLLFVESLGQFGIIAFFILSGFGLYLSFERLESSGEQIRFHPFIKRRLHSLLPQYYLCIGIVLLLTAKVGYLSIPNIFHIILSLLLLQNFDPQNVINGVTWTIAVLFQLYLISIPLYHLIKKWGWRAWALGAIVAVCLRKIMAMYIAINGLEAYYYVITSIRIPFTTIDLILAGMFASKLCSTLPARIINILKRPQTIVFCVVSVLLYHYIFIKALLWGGELWGNSWLNCIWQSVIGIYLAMICIALYFLPFSYNSKIGKGIQFIANNEYGIYLWHMLLQENFMQFQPDWYIWLKTNLPIGFLIVLLSIAVFVGWISSKLSSGESYQSLFGIFK